MSHRPIPPDTIQQQHHLLQAREHNRRSHRLHTISAPSHHTHHSPPPLPKLCRHLLSSASSSASSSDSGSASPLSDISEGSTSSSSSSSLAASSLGESSGSPYPSPSMKRIYSPIPDGGMGQSGTEVVLQQQIHELLAENEFLYASLERMRSKYVELLQL